MHAVVPAVDHEPEQLAVPVVGGAERAVDEEPGDPRGDEDEADEQAVGLGQGASSVGGRHGRNLARWGGNGRPGGSRPTAPGGGPGAVDGAHCAHSDRPGFGIRLRWQDAAAGATEVREGESRRHASPIVRARRHPRGRCRPCCPPPVAGADSSPPGNLGNGLARLVDPPAPKAGIRMTQAPLTIRDREGRVLRVDIFAARGLRRWRGCASAVRTRACGRS